MPTTFPSPDDTAPQRVVLCVTCIVYDTSRTHVLLHKRDDADLWSLPGGAVDPGETAAEASIREVMEETGLAVTPLALLAIDSDVRNGNLVHYPDGNINQNAALIIECEPATPIEDITAVFHPTHDDSHEARLFPLADLPPNLPPPHSHRLAKLIANPNPPRAELD